MLKGRKGIMVYALMLMIITVVLLFSFFKLGARVAEAIGFGTSKLEPEFDRLAKELNSLNAKSRQEFMFLEPNTAIIGFSRDADSFKCISCGSESYIISYFNKPKVKECGDSNDKKSCICLCKTQLQVAKSGEMKCDDIVCKTLKKDLINSVELKDYILEFEKNTRDNYDFLKKAKWEGGFLYERKDYFTNGLPWYQGNKFTVFLQQDNIDGNDYVAVCPDSGCIDKFKPVSQPKIPPNICEVMYQCIDSQKIKRVPPDEQGNVYCDYGNNIIATKYITQKNCEDAKNCVDSKLNLIGECKKLDFYELSYK